MKVNGTQSSPQEFRHFFLSSSLQCPAESNLTAGLRFWWSIFSTSLRRECYPTDNCSSGANADCLEMIRNSRVDVAITLQTSMNLSAGFAQRCSQRFDDERIRNEISASNWRAESKMHTPWMWRARLSASSFAFSSRGCRAEITSRTLLLYTCSTCLERGRGRRGMKSENCQKVQKGKT